MSNFKIRDKRPRKEQNNSVINANVMTQVADVLPVYHIFRHSYKRSRLQALMDAKGFTKINRNLEDEHCEADLMYALFKRPSTIIQPLLTGMFEIAKKKNSPDILQSRMIRESIKFLLENPNASNNVKVFNILLILNREPETIEIFKTGYVIDHPGNLFGSNCHAHLDNFLSHLKLLLYNTFRVSFGETNVVDIIHQVVIDAEFIYLSKSPIKK